MIWRQEVPAENLVCQSQVALEDRRHLSIEVFSAAELLQHLHRQHEDLAQAVLLEVKRMEEKQKDGWSQGKMKKGSLYCYTEKVVRQGTNLEQTLAAAMKLHAEANAAGLTGAGELTEQSGKD